MSVTRRTWTDDSGNLSSGTIVNNAELQRVYDDIDARWSVVTITSVGTQNNLAISEADFVIFNNATDLTVTGIGAPSSPAKPGKPMRYVCIGAGNVFFADSASATASTSTAANRIICFAKSGLTPHAGGSGAGMMVYDATVALPRWRLSQHEQGAGITPTFAAGNFTGNASMTWTVDAGDVSTFTYVLRGRWLTVNWNLTTTTVAGTPSTTLQIGNGAWGGFSAVNGSQFGAHDYQDNAGTHALGRVTPIGNTLIGLQKVDVSNWAAATNATASFGSVTFQVQ